MSGPPYYYTTSAHQAYDTGDRDAGASDNDNNGAHAPPRVPISPPAQNPGLVLDPVVRSDPLIVRYDLRQDISQAAVRQSYSSSVVGGLPWNNSITTPAVTTLTVYYLETNKLIHIVPRHGGAITIADFFLILRAFFWQEVSRNSGEWRVLTQTDQTSVMSQCASRTMRCQLGNDVIRRIDFLGGKVMFGGIQPLQTSLNAFFTLKMEFP
ncbi:hypothetical protein M422DRAFT_51163 [Sphaerobolus stellatus SS14]|uniref:DUF6699 domain-containing protein n=1 Tax=Sphaerobolus stellatus (strain SS14) TaxID=990650 RepID=A0A0C9UN14_SPHS4|nr:hypothetical protein M422DRAFT_51163 [Sphaerobolus stellatus SS14]